MTTEEKIQILQDAEVRAYQTLAKFDGESMCTAEFGHLLNNISQLGWMAHAGDPARTGDPVPPPPVPEPEKPVEPEPEKPAPKEEKTVVKLNTGEVRGALAAAHRRGVNVAELIQSFGAATFNDLKPEQYPAVLAKLEEC